MAATVSACNKPGAWALDSEENEAELLHQHNQDSVKKSTIPESDFPSLGAVAKTKASKKKKPQTLSLQAFSSYNIKGLTPDELIILPTAPRERTEEELNQSRIGGGFRSYDNNRGARVSDDSRRSNREFVPSRADEIDNWGAGKKYMNTVGGGFDRRERGERERGGFFSDSVSRADEVDNWGSKKSFVPSDGRRNERRVGGFESNGGGADEGNWLKKKEQEAGKFGGSFDSLRSRRGSNESINSSDSDTWGRKKEEFNVNGNDNVVAVRPRLNLKPRTKPLDDGQKEKETGSDDVVKPKGLNPFGEARPREEVLKEKGQDWKEIDEKLEAEKSKEIKEVGNFTDGKRGFGISNGRGRSSERAWRKPDAEDPRPSSSGKSENGHVEEPQDGEAQA